VRTQVDVVLPHGTVVLNADDPQVVDLASLCDGKVIFYALEPTSQVLVGHRAIGERVVFVEGRDVVLAQGQETVARIALNSLSADVRAMPGVVLAASAVAWALGMAAELIGAGLRTFELTPTKKYIES
jgi:cyanophycin synthetase